MVIAEDYPRFLGLAIGFALGAGLTFVMSRIIFVSEFVFSTIRFVTNSAIHTIEFVTSL